MGLLNCSTVDHVFSSVIHGESANEPWTGLMLDICGIAVITESSCRTLLILCCPGILFDYQAALQY